MSALTFDELKDKLRGLLGVHEDSTGSVKDKVGQAFQRPICHQIGQRQAANKPLFGQTGSTSATQPLIEQSMFQAEDACVVHSVSYLLPLLAGNGVAQVSVTVSTSDNWTIEVRKRLSPTYSVGTTLVATLTSNTDSISPNLAGAKIACTLATGGQVQS